MKKTAVITGATSGIGASFAKILASKGYNLIITGRRKNKINILADELSEKYNIKIKVIIAELSDKKNVNDIIKYINIEKSIDLLVNNAGYSLYKYFLEADITEHEKMISVHILSVIKIIKVVLPKMIKQGYGDIINVSSLGAMCPVKKDAVYCGTKSFLNTFSESLYMEVKDKGIKVQALCPGFTRTDFHNKLKIKSDERKKIEKFKWMSPDKVAKYSLKCLKKNKVICIPGSWNKKIVKTVSLLPKSLYYRIVK